MILLLGKVVTNFYKKRPVMHTDQFSEIMKIPELSEFPVELNENSGYFFLVNVILQIENLSFY